MSVYMFSKRVYSAVVTSYFFVLQTAHCYIHAAALVAEYLKRQGKIYTSTLEKSDNLDCAPAFWPDLASENTRNLTGDSLKNKIVFESG